MPTQGVPVSLIAGLALGSAVGCTGLGLAVGEGAWEADRTLKPSLVLGPGYLDGAEAPKVFGHELHVQQDEPARAHSIHQMHQSDLGRIGDAMEHRLTEERPAHRHAVLLYDIGEGKLYSGIAVWDIMIQVFGTVIDFGEYIRILSGQIPDLETLDIRAGISNYGFYLQYTMEKIGSDYRC